MPRKVRTEASIAQNRDAQRRSRARRRDLVEDLQRRVAEYERQGVQATQEMQRAARAIMDENARLKALLAACRCGAAGPSSFADNFPGSPQGNLQGDLSGSVQSNVSGDVRGDCGGNLPGNLNGAADPAVNPGHHHEVAKEGGAGMQMQTQTQTQAQMQIQTQTQMEMERDMRPGHVPVPVPPPVQKPGPSVPRPDRARIVYVCNGVLDEACCPAEDEDEDDNEGAGGGSCQRRRSSGESGCGDGDSEGKGTGKSKGREEMGIGTGRSRQPAARANSASGSVGSGAESQRMSPAADETHCDEAVAILLELQECRGGADPAQARAVLGCGRGADCVVKNTRLFQLMDEMS